MAVTVEVELDVFSGRPNPAWILPETDARALLARIAELTGISARKLSNNLGYRGFMLHVLSGTETREIRVQNGSIQVSSPGNEAFYNDRDRAVERWLLESGWPSLDNATRSIMRAELPQIK